MMAFSKSFPRTLKGSSYPVWEEISLTEEEELEQEKKSEIDNLKLMEYCIEKAEELIKNKELKDYQSDVIKIAVSLFEKRASHVVYYKESKCKEKFDEKFKE